MTTGWIYALADPRDGSARYVGQTRRPPHNRLHDHLTHIHQHQRCDEPKTQWLRELHHERLSPLLIILEQAPSNQLNQRELHWRHLIAHAQNQPSRNDGWIGPHKPPRRRAKYE